VIGTGEIFAGSVVSFMVGMVAQVFGIQYILYVATGAMVLGFIVTLFLKETAPSKINRQNI
ncbi:MAG: MFS transporter, partial [Gammaproteobacteria bacterium]|nr:MFS transporter [Gammaproteobacteria bacterium]